MMTPERATGNFEVMEDEHEPVSPMMHLGDLESQSLVNDESTYDVSANINNSVDISMTSENCKIIDESDNRHSPCPDPDGKPAFDMMNKKGKLDGSAIVPDSANVTPIKSDSGLQEQDTFTSSPTYSRDILCDNKHDEGITRPFSRRQQRMKIIRCYGLVAVVVLICAIGIPLAAVMLFNNQNSETSFSDASNTANSPSAGTVTPTTVAPNYKPGFAEETMDPYFTEEEKTKLPEWVDDEDGDTDAPVTWEEEDTDQPEEVVVTQPPTNAPVRITKPPVAVTEPPLGTIEEPEETNASVVGGDLTELLNENNVTSEGNIQTKDPSENQETTKEPKEKSASPTFSPTALKTVAATPLPTVRATTAGPTVPPTSKGPDRSGVYFGLVNVTDPALLQDTASPQAMAYLWLVEKDQILPIPEGQKLIQRYALNVMDHILHNPMEPLLSDPTMDECFWSGVVCDEDTGEVIEVNWARQGLNGGLAAEMKLLTSLDRIDFSENELQGTLDPLYESTELKHVYLHNNNFTGSLSELIGSMHNLTSLYLGHNQLTGQVSRVRFRFLGLLVGLFLPAKHLVNKTDPHVTPF
jgi:Leucine-rich repeat (LRR) protein